MRASLRRLRDEETGFTLIEMVMTVGILGIIVSALTGVVLSYFRVTVDTEVRLTENHDVQLAAAYWQRDVASIGVRSNVYDTASHSFALQRSVDVAGCPLTGASAGATPVVTLAWSEYTSLDSSAAPGKVGVTYAYRAGALYRVRCDLATSAVSSTLKLADNLSAAPVASCFDPARTSTACTGTGGNVPAFVDLRLQVLDASGHDDTIYDRTLSGERRQS
jgi:prepilin-type N-terminal cleavage/methylation domain-containing protein